MRGVGGVGVYTIVVLTSSPSVPRGLIGVKENVLVAYASGATYSHIPVLVFMEMSVVDVLFKKIVSVVEEKDPEILVVGY